MYRFNSRKQQGGYATVLGVILMTTMALTIFSLYDVGQVTTHKMRGQNASDAAAYSVATFVSRDLNFIATTNRAMVANQIAIGQMVGLSSYGHMIERTASNIDIIGDIAQFIPYVGPVIKRITALLEKAAEAMESAFDKAAKAVIPMNEIILGLLSTSQTLFHNGMLVSSQQVFNKVAKDNDPDIESSVVVGAYTVANFISEHNKTLERNTEPSVRGGGRKNRLHLKRYGEFEQVVKGSQDKFLNSRYTRYLAGTVRGLGGNDFRRRAIRNKYVWEWTAMDTMRVRVGPCWFGCLLKAPLGWGAGHALNQGSYYNYRRDTRRWGGAWRNSSAAWWARRTDSRNNLARTRSIRPFYDLEEDGLRETGPAMVSILKKPVKPVRTWKEASKDIPNYNLQQRYDVAKDGGIAKDQMLSISKAEPYFSRPRDLWRRKDNNLEYGNLYNPFWQPRLVETSSAERVAVMAAAAGINL